jgi:hypothetical protein
LSTEVFFAALGWAKKKREQDWYPLVFSEKCRSGSQVRIWISPKLSYTKIRKMTEKNYKFKNKKFSKCICMKKFISLGDASSLPETTAISWKA